MILTWQDVVISILLPVDWVACYQTGHRLVPPNIHLHWTELVKEQEQDEQEQDEQKQEEQEQKEQDPKKDKMSKSLLGRCTMR